MTGKGIVKYLVFYLDKHRHAFPLFCIERIVRSVEITPLPKAPEIVLGLINFKGQIMHVIDLRRRFNYPEKEIDISDKLIIVSTADRASAFLVADIQNIIEVAEKDVFPPEDIIQGVEYVQEVIRRDDGIILVHQLDRILTEEEEFQLKKAIRKRSGKAKKK